MTTNNPHIYFVSVNKGRDLYEIIDSKHEKPFMELTLNNPVDNTAVNLYAAKRGTRYYLITIHKYENSSGKLMNVWNYEDCILEETNNQVNNLQIKFRYRVVNQGV